MRHRPAEQKGRPIGEKKAAELSYAKIEMGFGN
jgi:hypothetical protein